MAASSNARGSHPSPQREVQGTVGRIAIIRYTSLLWYRLAAARIEACGRVIM